MKIAKGSLSACTHCDKVGTTIYVSFANSPKTNITLILGANNRRHGWFCHNCFIQLLTDMNWISGNDVVERAQESVEEPLLVKAEIDYLSDGASLVTLVDRD